MKNIFQRKSFLSVATSAILSMLTVVAVASASTTIDTSINTGGTLEVTGVSTLTGAVTTGAAATVGTDLTVTSGARVGTGSSGTHLTALADDSLLVEGTSEFDGISWFDGQLQASSTALFGSTVTTYADATVGTDLTVSSGAEIGASTGGHLTDLADNTLLVAGASEFNGTSWFDGQLQASSTALFGSAATFYGGILDTGTISAGTWNGTKVGVPYGGTGWATVNSGTVLYGNGTSALATTSAGTNGNILALSGGVPAWIATSTMPFTASAMTTAGDLLYGGVSGAATRLAVGVPGTNGILGTSAGNPAWIATSSALNLAISDTIGTLAATKGGTGLTAYTTGDLVYGSASNVLSALGIGATSGYVLSNNGGIPTWVATSTLSTITGTLAATKGGTGLATYATGDLVYASADNTLAARGAGTNGNILAMTGGVPAWIATSTMPFAPTADPTFTGTVNGAAMSLTGNLTVSGTFSPAIASSTQLSTTKFYAGGGANATTTIDNNSNLLVGGTLGVTGLSTLAGVISTASSTMVSNLNITGPLYASSSLVVDGNVTLGGGFGDTGITISNTGNIQANGTLAVGGTSSLNGGASTTALSLSSTLMVNGNATTTSAGAISTQGTLTVGNGGSSVTDMVHGYCTIAASPTITASTTASIACAATVAGSGTLSTAHRIFVSATTTVPANYGILAASSTSASNIQLSISNSNVDSAVTTFSAIPVSLNFFGIR